MIGGPESSIALSAMSSLMRQLSVTSNNLANINTSGFSRSRADLRELPSGLGVDVGRVAAEIGGGAIESTGISTHMALAGNGFFAVRDPGGGLSYTRSGAFHFDRSGFLVDSGGRRVQGFNVNAASGAAQGTARDIQLPTAAGSVRATSSVKLSLNLDSNSSTPAAFNVNNAPNTANFSTSATVVDSLGNPHAVEMHFRKAGTDTVTDPTTGASSQVARWEWYGVTSESGTPTLQANGTLRFRNDGALYDATTADSTFTFSGVKEQNVAFSFGESVAQGGSGLNGTTQFAADSVVNGISGDGSGYGAVMGTRVDASGTVFALYGNGQSSPVARVAVATFASTTGLSPVGENLFAATPESGQALLGSPGAAGAGTIYSGALETSNVDLSTELVQLLRTQGGYRANLRLLTVNDSLTQEIINLRR